MDWRRFLGGTVRRLAIYLVTTIVIFYAVLFVVLHFQQGRFIYFPMTEIIETPRDYGIEFSEVSIPVGRNDKLHGWWIPGSETTVLYLHGNGGNIGVNAGHAARFRQLGYSVLIFDYRGYGRSTGEFPTEKRVYEGAEAAWDFLLRERNRVPGQIVLYGHSLGGAVAIEMAKQHPDAAALISESTFTSVLEMANLDGLFAMLPIKYILRERYDSLDKIEKIVMPKLIIHGEDDSIVPPGMARKLFEKAPEPKRLLMIPGAEHDNTAAIGGQRWFDAVQDFVSGLPQ